MHTGREEQGVLYSISDVNADKNSSGTRGGSSSEIVNYATSWVGKVHYVLRFFGRTF